MHSPPGCVVKLLVITVILHLVIAGTAVAMPGPTTEASPRARLLTGGGTDYRDCYRVCNRKYGLRDRNRCNDVCRNVGRR